MIDITKLLMDIALTSEKLQKEFEAIAKLREAQIDQMEFGKRTR